MDNKIIGYVNAGEYETPQQAYDESEGWVTCDTHTKDRILAEFQELVKEYQEKNLVHTPKKILDWVLARHKGMDDLFEITEEMVAGHSTQCPECYDEWTNELYESSMKDAVARWENRLWLR
jgi:hypothetical protein